MATDALAAVFDPKNPEIVQYRQQAPELLALADALVIASDTELAFAAEHTKTSSAACRAIKAMFKPAKDALNEAKKQVTALESGLLVGFEKADTILRRKMADYRNEQLRRASEERRQREAEERKRREDEQLAQAARLETLARTTGEAHYQRSAEFVLDQPVRVAVAAVAPAKPEGISFREETSVEVTDIAALVAAVAAGEVNIAALSPNYAWLRTEAKQRGAAMKDGDMLFPGVLVTKTTDVTVRTR